MAKDIEKIIQFLQYECEQKKNVKKSGIRYSKKFKDGIRELHESGLTDKQILKLVPVSIYSVQNWTNKKRDKTFKKIKVVNNVSPVSLETKNANVKVEELLGQIKSILTAELVLTILLLFYLLSLD